MGSGPARREALRQACSRGPVRVPGSPVRPKRREGRSSEPLAVSTRHQPTLRPHLFRVPFYRGRDVLGNLPLRPLAMPVPNKTAGMGGIHSGRGGCPDTTHHGYADGTQRDAKVRGRGSLQGEWPRLMGREARRRQGDGNTTTQTQRLRNAHTQRTRAFRYRIHTRGKLRIRTPAAGKDATHPHRPARNLGHSTSVSGAAGGTGDALT